MWVRMLVQQQQLAGQGGMACLSPTLSGWSEMRAAAAAGLARQALARRASAREHVWRACGGGGRLVAA